MNIPLPTVVPTTNATLKENADTASSSAGTLKISNEEVLLSTTTTEEVLLNSSENLANVVISQILTNKNNSLQAPILLSHNLMFLSPETVNLEIQITELLELLESESTTLETPAEPQTSNAKTTILPFQSAKPTPKGLQNTKTSNTTLQENQTPSSSSKMPLSLGTKNVSPQPEISTGIDKQDYEVNSSIQTFLQKPSTEKESSQHSARPQGYTSEQKEELIFTTKSQELYKDSRNNKDPQKDNRHQDQQQNQQEEEKKKKPNQSTSKIKENSSSQEISLASLRYHYETRPIKEAETTEGSTFKKKAPSPMALFKETPISTQNSALIQTPKIENVFIRFMKLMARILGQAEAEAHELYLRVKERTDNVDALTLLISKINAEKKDINWSNNDEMKALVDRAASLGVTVNFEKNYIWKEDEKKLFKENIQMRKENMEKITQLERTDMQRHLQEVSQCHQARSNVLKLLKELMDTFTYNLRP
ncbi:hypothetical protein [Chlamydia sp. 17-3921]|uniref:hypothetical protein n=1 Tax=Chlamydia sp. 17-3921 TaxID=2675798 RepID=UPI00191902E8|nr:hypothetical protein [Chlamydia sp. 17-3921]